MSCTLAPLRLCCFFIGDLRSKRDKGKGAFWSPTRNVLFQEQKYYFQSNDDRTVLWHLICCKILMFFWSLFLISSHAIACVYTPSSTRQLLRLSRGSNWFVRWSSNRRPTFGVAKGPSRDQLRFGSYHVFHTRFALGDHQRRTSKLSTVFVTSKHFGTRRRNWHFFPSMPSKLKNFPLSEVKLWCRVITSLASTAMSHLFLDWLFKPFRTRQSALARYFLFILGILRDMSISHYYFRPVREKLQFWSWHHMPLLWILSRWSCQEPRLWAKMILKTCPYWAWSESLYKFSLWNERTLNHGNLLCKRFVNTPMILR